MYSFSIFNLNFWCDSILNKYYSKRTKFIEICISWKLIALHRKNQHQQNQNFYDFISQLRKEHLKYPKVSWEYLYKQSSIYLSVDF